MIARQAIQSTIMDITSSSRTSGSNGIKASSTKGKDSISFESLLSNKPVADIASSNTLEMSNRDTKKTTASKVTKEISNDNTTVNESRTSSQDAKDEIATIENTKTSSASKTEDSKLDTVAKTVKEVKEIVLETLNISEEELESMMEILGLTMVDLLNPDALKQLTLENAGTNDFMMLLTDEGLSQQWNKLLDQLQGVLEQNGMNQQELTKLLSNEGVFNQLIDKILADAKESLLTDAEQELAVMEEDANSEMKNLASDSTDNVSSSNVSKSQIDFTVERYDQEGSTSSQSNSEADKNQEPGLSTSELSNQFLDQMVNSTKTTQAQFSQQLTQLSEIREIANQVLEQIKLVIKPAQTTMEFTLNPEHLGKVALNITSKEGMITATFTTQNQIAKEAIESQLQIFKENLNNQGLKVDIIEVNVSNFSFEGSNQMDQSNSNQQEAAKGKKTTLRVDAEDNDFLEDALSGLDQGDSADYGNNFDYIA